VSTQHTPNLGPPLPLRQFEPFNARVEGSRFDGWPIDGSKTRFWATKKEAQAAAKAIGWPAGSVSKMQTRFQIGWGLVDGAFGTLRRDWYERAKWARENNQPMPATDRALPTSGGGR